MHPSSERGFTLIELLIVVAIIGIIAAIAIPIICYTPDGTPVPLDGSGGAMAPSCLALR